MSAWRPADVELDHCPRCKGLWFDGNELMRHLANLGGRPLTEAPRVDVETLLDCPRCRDTKLRGGLLLDVAIECCPRCQGIFLDLGEVAELLGVLDRPTRASNPRSSLSGFDNFALGLFVGMRRRGSR